MPTDNERTAALMNANGGYWGEHPRVPVTDWREAVANGDTRLGYWEYASEQIISSLLLDA